MLNHYKARAVQAEKTLARSRLRLVGRSLVLMVQTQRGKDPELSHKSKGGHNAMQVRSPARAPPLCILR